MERLLRQWTGSAGPKQAYAYYRWVRESMASNMPFDQFARAVVTAEGPLGEVAPANCYKVVSRPGDEAGTLSQVFLGVARCGRPSATTTRSTAGARPTIRA